MRICRQKCKLPGRTPVVVVVVGAVAVAEMEAAEGVAADAEGVGDEATK